MPTCPNCGEVVMEGDPYCSHCGAHFKWDFTDEEDDSSSPYDFPASIPAYEAQRDFEKPDDYLDFGEVSETYADIDDDTMDYIVSRVSPTPSRQKELKALIRQYQKAPDFRGFYIKKDYEFEVYYFHFIQENEYVKTDHVMTYITEPDYCRPYRVFYEEYSLHTHEGLVRNPRFVKMIENTGLEFDGCGGGYRCRQEEIGGDVTLTGEIDMRVYFRVAGKKRQYKLDLNNMQLI